MPRGGYRGKPGRKKGVPNKRTYDLIEQLEALGIDIPREIFRLLNRIEELSTEPKKQLACMRLSAEIYLKLMPFVYPTRKAQEAPPTEPIETDVTYVSEWGSRHEPSDTRED